jgi:hypothetical protein
VEKEAEDASMDELPTIETVYGPKEAKQEKEEVSKEEPEAADYTPSVKRPDDEFVDLKEIVALREEPVTENASIIKVVTREGHGRCVDPADTVYYRHETRFDNG